MLEFMLAAVHFKLRPIDGIRLADYQEELCGEEDRATAAAVLSFEQGDNVTKPKA
jgi:hypothetical protein